MIASNTVVPYQTQYVRRKNTDIGSRGYICGSRYMLASFYASGR